MPHLESLLQAGSVAVVGARDDTSTYGGRAWTYLTRAFRGTATAVNARTGAVRSRRCVATLAEVDPAPQVVVLATPADTVIALLEQAGTMGTSAAVIFSRDLFGSEEQIRAVADRFGMSVLGPNCLGLINTNAGVILSSSISLERPSRPGPLAFVSQSGALMGLLHARSIDLGLGMGMCVSTGSQAVLRAEDFLLELAGRDDVGAVGVYLESIDVPGFTAAAEALAQRDIRLVALRAGSTSAGSRAATAHSGALAGSGAAFTALAHDLGVVVVDDPGELLTTLALASTKGRRWHITTSSGGMAAIAADQATALGVELPPVRAGLGAPPAGQARLNPTDLDAEAATTRQKLELIAELAGEPGLDGVLVVVSDMPFAREFTRELAQVVTGAGRVFVVSECSQQLAPVWHEWVAAGLAYLPGLAPALRAIGRLHGRTPGWARAPGGGPVPGGERALGEGWPPGGNEPALARGAQLFPPGEVEALLSEAGLPMLPAREVGSAPEATSAAESLGYPVVVKVSRALHRGPRGVRLGLGDASEVAAAYRELAAEGPVLVQRQSPPGLECYIGVRADPVFGRLLLLGAGGPGVEELADIVIGRDPLEPGQIGRLVASTQFGRWLSSPASRALFDIGSLVPIAAQALRALAELPDLESLDLNPIVVTQEGAIVVDAKATGRWPRSARPQLRPAAVPPGHREVPA
jgi:acyl-CoA synthetase (NDP forming)